MTEDKNETQQLGGDQEFETQELEPQEMHMETEVERVKKKRREMLFEMALFLVLGILIGVTLKTEAVKRFTIGFDDYKLSKPTASYNINEIKSKLSAQVQQQQAQAEAQQQIQAAAQAAQNQAGQK